MHHLLLFQTTRAVIKAERLCRKNGFACKVIPVPRTISSECGMAIEIHPEDSKSITALCAGEGIVCNFASCE